MTKYTSVYAHKPKKSHPWTKGFRSKRQVREDRRPDGTLEPRGINDSGVLAPKKVLQKDDLS